MERNEDMIYTMLQRLQESVLVLAGVLTHLSTTLKG